MADVSYEITDHRAPRVAASPMIRQLAERIMADAAAATPHDTGRLRDNWHVEAGRDPGTFFVANDVPYGRFVEYGTKNPDGSWRTPPRAMLGRAVARRRSRR